MRILRDIRAGVKSVIAWLPIVWKDRNWDSYYFLKVVNFKIEQMANSIEKNDIFDGSDEVVADMRQLVIIGNRLLEGDYMSQERSDLLSKWWNLRTEKEECGLISMVWDDESPEYKAIRARLEELRVEEEAKEQKDREDFFNGILHQHRSWWD